MKKLLLFWFIVAGLTGARAQDSLQFAANLTLVEPLPPFPVPHAGQGLFTLSGNTLSYRIVVTPYGLGSLDIGQILGGPAGPVLFSLPLTGCTTPIGTDLGSCSFRGTLEVPSMLVPDLLDHRWYVSVTYHSSPEVNLRGRIELVPEPSILTFAVISGGLIGLQFWLRLRYPVRKIHSPHNGKLGGEFNDQGS